MRTRHPTSPIASGELITGHFDEGRGYRILREAGTSDWLLIYTVRGRGRFGFRAP